MSQQTWRKRYVYVKAYAMQSAGPSIVYHALPDGDGPYFPPSCLRSSYTDALLVRRSHMEAVGARPCKRCHRALVTADFRVGPLNGSAAAESRNATYREDEA